jgi:large subunit ribosomal protein L35
MPKLKTKRAVMKRFKKTSTGKFLRRKAFKSHILEKKSEKRKRSLCRKVTAAKGDAKNIQKVLPYT